ncbi:MAG: endo-1,4-beta-xylanase [Treponema sp.]|nr:endo-1,4-beta-xylanase [Treponema sp.]
MKKNILKLTGLLSVIAVLFVVGGSAGAQNAQPAQSRVDMMTLPAMKDQFSQYFMIGNIFNPSDINASGVTNARLTRHFNVLTAENDMKPDKIAPTRNSFNFGTADRMVNAALASNIKVVGHTLLWHSQIPGWHRSIGTNNVTPEAALQTMKDYITNVVTHFKGRIYCWDVLNEAFPDGGLGSDWRTSMRSGAEGNPWFMKIGANFVYEGFLAARLADPDAILYYNDYNLDQSAKARLVHDMVRDVNAQYRRAFPNERRLLIEGIGMQSHHNTNVSPSNIRATLNLFRTLGVKISISELDVLSQTWSQYSSRAALTEAGSARAAQLYGEYFTLFLENSDIIERVTFWGVYDEQSWRARANPLIFEGRTTSYTKPAYFSIMAALDAHRRR